MQQLQSIRSKRCSLPQGSHFPCCSVYGSRVVGSLESIKQEEKKAEVWFRKTWWIGWKLIVEIAFLEFERRLGLGCCLGPRWEPKECWWRCTTYPTWGRTEGGQLQYFLFDWSHSGPRSTSVLCLYSNSTNSLWFYLHTLAFDVVLHILLSWNPAYIQAPPCSHSFTSDFRSTGFLLCTSRSRSVLSLFQDIFYPFQYVSRLIFYFSLGQLSLSEFVSFFFFFFFFLFSILYISLLFHLAFPFVAPTQKLP